MSLPLTNDAVAAAYDYLLELPPFIRMNLPAAEEVKFSLYKRRDRFAEYSFVRSRHHIKISSVLVGSHAILLSTLAHEILHLYLQNTGCFDMRSPHGVGFNKLADQVCRIHSFDRLTF